MSTPCDSSEDFRNLTEFTVYIEGIPYAADEADLNAHFEPCGPIKAIRLPRYHDSGKIRGYGHIEFSDSESFQKALEMDGKYLKDRYLKVKPAEVPKAAVTAQKDQGNVKAVKGCRTVFLKQIPYDADEDVIREALSACGEIVNVRLPIWAHTKKRKGFGYVEFESEEGACNAAKRSGMKIGGRIALINLERGTPKASFRLPDGQYWSKSQTQNKRPRGGAKKVNQSKRIRH